jgi:hypothetical protein
MAMIETEADRRKEAAHRRADAWRRMLTPDRNAIIGALRLRARTTAGPNASCSSDDATLAADLLEDIADGRI